MERHGWELKRVQGSHHIDARPGNPARISMLIHMVQPLEDWVSQASDEAGGH
ncbi:MAG: type II toxin-antitoxin system HicA family toxin [Gammaproteobacteria bacterium]